MNRQEPLQALPRLTPPHGLVSRLRVLASREAARRRRFASAEAFVAYARDLISLWFDHLARPYAVPFAGGLASTVFLFAMIAPTLTVQRPAVDVPTGLSTPAVLAYSLSSVSLVHTADIVIDVTIDEEGRVVGYSLPRGQGWLKDRALLNSIERTLLFTRFTPATLFGGKVAGRTRITLRHSSVDVQG
jgi:hypothetical protein